MYMKKNATKQMNIIYNSQQAATTNKKVERMAKPYVQ